MSVGSATALLHPLLEKCVMNKTHVTEAGITVGIDTLIGETIHFYRIDSESGRSCLDMRSSRCCDVLVTYEKKSDSYEAICFIELKGRKLKDAIIQIKVTYARIRERLETLLQRDQLHKVHYRAYIALRQRGTANEASLKQELIQSFGGNNVCIRHSKKHALGEFLRNTN